jgi:predicted NAD-dependent protein-ADP-ribosyltransferase YbiA (DUF1768 family)
LSVTLPPQASKTSDEEVRGPIREAKEPLEAKRLGAKVEHDRDAWKAKSPDIMEVGFTEKQRGIMLEHMVMRLPFLGGVIAHIFSRHK